MDNNPFVLKIGCPQQQYKYEQAIKKRDTNVA